MELKKIIIDGEEVEIALKLDDEYYEKNDSYDLEDTLEFSKIELEEGSNNE